MSEPPIVSIESPGDGASFDEGVTISMLGRVVDEAYDGQLDSLAATWAVDGGRVCSGAVFDSGGLSTCDYVFTAGEATITLTATDPAGQAATATATVQVNVNSAPTAQIIEPTPSGNYYSNYPIVFSGLATDGEDAADQLTVTFEDASGVLDIDGRPTSAGEVSGSVLLAEGNHFITMTVTDTTGRTGEDTVAIDVNGPNTIPSCVITAPESGFTTSTGETILFEGVATDPDIPYNTLDVSWVSDKDGVFGTSTPNSAGEFFVGVSTLSTNTHTITLEVTDETGALCTDAILVQIGNGPLVILDEPTTGSTYNQGDDLTFSARVSDAEDAATQVGFVWESDVDGTFSTQGANSSGVAAFTYDRLSLGTHTITVTATDTDGIASIDRATITVNGLPTAPGVTITPDPSTSGDNLTATVTTASTDPEGEAITYRYAWYQDGVVTAYTTNTINASAHSRGENWEVRVYANDGHGDSAPGTDSTTITNGAPSITTVTISPSTAYTNDTLTASATGWSDPDGDGEQLRYQWAKNGTDISGATDSTLEGSEFVKNDVITVTITPFDGYTTGTPVTSSSRTIRNSTPTAPTVSISPEYPEADDMLTCAVATASTDDDGDSISYTWSWTRNASATGIVSSTVDSSYTSNGDVWVCSVTASDGTATSSAGTDSATVGDYTAPSAPTLSSISPYRNEDYVTVSGSAEALSTVTLYKVTSTGTTTQSTSASASGSFSFSLTSLTRGGEYSFYAIATDGAGNNSSVSNTLSTEVCDPYDDYDLSTPSGDTCSDSITDWSTLNDSGGTVLTVTGNILDSSDEDWYLVQTSDLLSAGINYYRFHVELTHGSGNYVFIVHDGGCADAYIDCSTSGYTEYEVYAYDRNDSAHGTPADTRYCNYGSSPLYNNCDDLSSDYYIEVQRVRSSYDCEYYELEISNGIW